MTIKQFYSIFIIGLVLICCFLVVQPETTAYDVNSWKDYFIITIDHTKVSGNLKWFPVLIDITSTYLKTAQSDGDDFLFTDNSLNKLNHEIDKWDSSTGHLLAWVNVTQITQSSDVTIRLYWNYQTVSNQQNSYGTWNSDFDAVYHMNDLNNSAIKDSTINKHNLTKKSANAPIVSTSGKIGDCQDFDGNDDWAYCSGFNDGNVVSMEAWVNCEAPSFTGKVFRILQQGHGLDSNNYSAFGVTLYLQYLQSIFDLSSVKNQYVRRSDCSIVLNTWYYLAVTRASGSRANLYKNGSVAGGTITERSSTWSGTIVYDTPNNFFSIGQFFNSASTEDGDEFNGKLDEVRVLKSELNLSWVVTTYNNMYNPTSFISVSALQHNLFPISISNVYPVPNSVDVETSPILHIYVSDAYGDNINITWMLYNPDDSKTYVIGETHQYEYGSWLPSNKTYYCLFLHDAIDSYELNKKYYWKVNITDGAGYSRDYPNTTMENNCYNFTTGDYNYTDALNIYNNTINTTGVYEYYYINGSGWDLYINFTGENTPINLNENIVNATGNHTYLLNNSGYFVYANYTGNVTSTVVSDDEIIGYSVLSSLIVSPILLIIFRRKKNVIH